MYYKHCLCLLLFVTDICGASDFRWTTSYTAISSGKPEVSFHIQNLNWVTPKITDLFWNNGAFVATFDSKMILHVGERIDSTKCFNGNYIQLQFVTMDGVGDRVMMVSSGGCDGFFYTYRVSPSLAYNMKVDFKPAMETDFELSSKLLHITADSDGSWQTQNINMRGKNIAYVDVTSTGDDISLLSGDIALNIKSGHMTRIQGPAFRAGYNASAFAEIKFAGTATTIGASRYNLNFSVTYV